MSVQSAGSAIGSNETTHHSKKKQKLPVSHPSIIVTDETDMGGNGNICSDDDQIAKNLVQDIVDLKHDFDVVSRYSNPTRSDIDYC